VLGECFGSYRSVRESVLKVLIVLGGVLEVSGVLEEYTGGFRSVRGSILEVLGVLGEMFLEVVGVLGGVFWRF